MFQFCVSTVSTVDRVINKTKSSFTQIFVYLISFVRGMQDVYQTCSQLQSVDQHLAKTKVWNKNRFVLKPISVVLTEISKRF